METTAKAAAQIEWGTERERERGEHGDKEDVRGEREVAENAAKFAVKKHLIVAVVVVAAAAVYTLLSALNL